MWVYDDNHNKIEFLPYFKDRSIVSVLSTGDKTLSFSYPIEKSKNLIEENYIRTESDEYVIKQTKTKDNYIEVSARLNVEDLEGKSIASFKTNYKSIRDTLDEMLVDTGWTVGTCEVTKKRTIEGIYKSVWELSQMCVETYNVELEYDTLNKKINVYDKRGSYKGVFMIDGINMEDLEIQSSSYDFYTRLIPLGKDGLSIASINDGKNYVENYQYSNKIKTTYWKDERYTIAEDLKEDAMLKLEEMSQPTKSYDVTLKDLAKMNKDKYKSYEFNLGDIILLVSKSKRVRLKERIVKYTEYPENPEMNKVELSTIKVTLEDIQKKFLDTATTVSNITTAGGEVSTDSIQVLNEMAQDIDNIDKKVSDKVDKVEGKELSTNDFTDEDKGKIHTHDNKTILDSITKKDMDSIHTHTNNEVLDTITEEKVKKWNDIASKEFKGDDIAFDKKQTNLISTNVQDAIIELYEMLENINNQREEV